MILIIIFIIYQILRREGGITLCTPLVLTPVLSITLLIDCAVLIDRYLDEYSRSVGQAQG